MMSLFVAIFLLSLASTTVALSCIECASAELHDRWHMTGYPVKLDKSRFLPTAKCAWSGPPTGKPEEVGIVQCDASVCLTMKLPAVNESGYASGTWILRGCYRTLMGDEVPFTIQPNGLTGQKSDACASGVITVFDNSSREVANTQASLYTCNRVPEGTTQEGPCNSAEASACAQLSLPMSCTKSVDGSPSTICDSAAYCFKYDVTQTRRTVVRGCSPFNPFIPPGTTYVLKSGAGSSTDKNSICVDSKIANYLPTRSITEIWSRKCFCNDNRQCNGATVRFVSTGSWILSAILAFLVLSF